jgi:hypothetical protein
MSASASAMPEQPKHPLHALTTYELRDLRRELERAIVFFEKKSPVPPARDQLQRQLARVQREQDSRIRLQNTSGRAE